MRHHDHSSRAPRVAITVTALLVGAGCAPAASARHVSAPPTSARHASAPPTSASAVPEAAAPVLSGRVSISGAASIPTTSFTVDAQMEVGAHQTAPPSQATCADYADGFAGTAPPSGGVGFVAPMLQTSGYHSIYVGVMMTTGYQGPGTYDTTRNPSLIGVAVEGIGSAGAVVYTVFHSIDHGAMTLTVLADGSGSLRIVHWDSDEVRQTVGTSQVTINGIVTWACRG
jgi:hypothetical protein